VLGKCNDFTRRLLRWYDRFRRDLPWRIGRSDTRPLDPYHVLVSETMLQQTQVATVIPYYHRFLERFPTLSHLAAADEQQVLRLWQGLGYYSRARNLQSAARTVVNKYAGRLPDTADELLKLPGIGRYTAGAVASLAFGRRSPILDGNVTRVLCRLDDVRTDPRQRENQALLWSRAEQILPMRRVGDFNSALMELGAVVCTPRIPKCLTCPVREHCAAHAAGVQEQIPTPRKAKPTPLTRRHTYCIRHDDSWLIEQRPSRGRWAGLWQFITLDAGAAPAGLPVTILKPTRIGTVNHALTHRRYQFEVFLARAKTRNAAEGDRPMRWVTATEIERYPLPRPHLKMLEMLTIRLAAG
jgi:A/G-specific adenine glycosylase